MPKPHTLTETLPDGTPFDLVLVEGGTFMMGSEEYNDEKPLHEVQLDDFYLGRYPVTQALWQVVIGENPAYFPHLHRPVENVSWHDCQAFLTKLNELTGQTYRLPTEAQWEYASRGGKYRRDLTYAGSNNLYEVSWYSKNSQDISQPVGRKRPNELGLYDLSGNLDEWCQDWYSEDYYKTCAKQGVPHDPEGPKKGEYRVVRGGSWDSYVKNCRVAFRPEYLPSAHLNDIGLRLSRTSGKNTVFFR